MKRFCLLLMLTAIVCFAQSQLLPKASLKKIIDDAENNFQTYKSRLKIAQQYDSTYHTNVLLEGSKENQINFRNGSLIQYHAYIADSASKQQAKILVEKWKTKIASTVSDYSVVQIDYKSGSRKTKGYRFTNASNPNISISIVLSKKEIDAYHWVLLTITKAIDHE